jgi:predicted MFS family arabinose efflux permease
MSLFARYRQSFAGLPRDAWLLSTVLLVNTSGAMVVFFLTLYLARHLGWPAERAGLAMSGYGVGMLAGTLTGGLLSDRLGAFRVQRLSLTGAGVLLVFLSFLEWTPLVFAAIVAWGFFASAMFPANATAMAAVCPPPVRARGFVLNRLAANLGVTIGPVVGGFLAQHNYTLLFWVDGLTCLLAAAASLRFFPAPRPVSAEGELHHDGRTPIRWLDDRIFIGLMAISFIIAMVFAQLFSTLGMYLKLSAGLPESQIGGLIAINTALIVIFQMPLTHATAHFSPTRVVALGALLLGAGFALTPWSNSVPYLAATIVVWTFGEMLTLPVMMALVSLRAPTGAQGRYQGLYTMSYSLGITVGPAAGTWVFTTSGGTALWLSIGVLGALASAAMLSLSQRWDGRKA